MAGRRFTVEIGTVFPADDPLARWMVGLSMGLNDLLHVNKRLIEGLSTDRPPFENVYEVRLAALHVWELSKFIRSSQAGSDEVAKFIEQLSDEARADLDEALAYTDPDDPHGFKAKFASARDQFAHYTELDHKLLGRAMRAVEGDSAELVVGERFGDFRAVYADEVAGQLFFPRTGEEQLDEFRAFVTQLRDATNALMRFVQRALDHYLSTLPAERRAAIQKVA